MMEMRINLTWMESAPIALGETLAFGNSSNSKASVSSNVEMVDQVFAALSSIVEESASYSIALKDEGPSSIHGGK